jgi:hypothetical protein
MSTSSTITSPTWIAKFNASLQRQFGIAVAHEALDFDRAAHRVDGARKLDEHAVAGVLDDLPAVPNDARLEERAPMLPQTAVGAFFVLADEAAVSGDVGHKERRQLPHVRP